jgi:hypothetical protein
MMLKTKAAIKNVTIGITNSTSDKIIWILVNGFPVVNQKAEISEIVVLLEVLPSEKCGN